MAKIAFKERLVELRKSRGLTQYNLANELGFSRGQIGNYEQGSREPDQATLLKIANFFDVSLDYLLGISDVRNHYDVVISDGDKTINVQVKSTQNDLSKREKLDIEKEAEKMIENIDKLDTVEFCGTPADDEDKEYLKLAYEKFLSDVRIYNKQKYTPKKFKK